MPQYSGLKNLEILAALNKKIGLSEIADAIRRVGLDPMLKKPVGKYSLGMRQRLGISYQDDQGIDHAEETQVSTEIQQPVIEGEKTEAEKEAEAEAKRAASQWWISVLVAFAAIAIIVAVIVVNKFARMMRMK